MSRVSLKMRFCFHSPSALYELRICFALNILFKEEVLAIKHGIGKLRNPVAQDQHAAFLREHEVELDMAVAIDKEVDVGMTLHILFCEEHQVLLIFAHKRWFRAIYTLHAAVFSPRKAQPHAPARVKEVEQTLAETVMKHLAQELKLMVGVAQPIAVRQEENLVGYLGGFGFRVHRHATFLLQIAVGPDIVIARKEVHLYAHISKFRYLTQETRVTFRHHIAIFVPEVEHIAQQIYGRSLMLYAVEKTHQASFLCASVRYGPRSKMGIAKKIYIFHRQ